MFETTNQLYKLIQYGIESTVYLSLYNIIHYQYFVNPNVGLLPLILIRVLHPTISHYAASIYTYIIICYVYIYIYGILITLYYIYIYVISIFYIIYIPI